jgi:hypothetical protein
MTSDEEAWYRVMDYAIPRKYNLDEDRVFRVLPRKVLEHRGLGSKGKTLACGLPQ